MLTRFVYQLLTEAIATTLDKDQFALFHASAPELKLAVVGEISKEKYFGFPKDVYSAFIVALALEGNIAIDQLKAHAAPGDVAPEPYDIDAVATAVGFKLDRTQIVWHRPKPPTLYPQLIQRWPEEAAKVGAIAAKIPFASARNAVWFANATHEALGLGDYVDYLLGRQIPVNDETMQLFIQGASVQLQTARAEWYNLDDMQLHERLPTGTDGKSVEQLDFESDLEKRIARRESVRDSSAKRRDKLIAEKKVRRSGVFDILEKVNGWQTTLDTLSLLEFPKLREVLTAAPVGVETAGGKTWLPTNLVKEIEAVYKITTPEDLGFVEQFIISKLAARVPLWFAEHQDGSLVIRKTPKIERQKGMDRKTRGIHRKLNTLIEKHGIDKIGDALLAIAGNTNKWKHLAGDAQPKPAHAKAH